MSSDMIAKNPVNPFEKLKRKKSSMKIDAASLILGGGLLMFALLAAVYVAWTQRHYPKHR